MVISACGPSQSEQVATFTQIAAGIYATQTAQVPTITPTFTPSPTATVTLTPTPTNTPTVTPYPTYEPGVIFRDDFSNPASGWEHFANENGLNDYANGGYRLFVNSVNSYFWDTVIISDMNDVIIEVDAQKVAGPLDSTYGVICRYVSPNDFYVFLISNNGYYGIWKMIKGEWSSVGATQWGSNDRIIRSGDASNHIRATCNKDNLTLEVNGSVLMDLYDTNLTAGEVGLYASSAATAGADILFDNFVVYRP